MAEMYVGEIRMFGCTFAPQGWAMCNGQVLSISQNAALFSLLGTTYGGNGTTTFQLPDLRGRVPMHMGNGTGLPPAVEGQVGGADNVTILESNMPTHSHPVLGTSNLASETRPGGAVMAKTGTPIYGPSPDENGGTSMNAGMIGPAGQSIPISVMQPYLVINFCIALVGVYPSRN